MNAVINLEYYSENSNTVNLRVYSSTICSEIATRKRQLLKIFEDTFDSYIKSRKQQNKFVWEFVKVCYKHSKKLLTVLWRLRTFCAFIMKLFLDFVCDDDLLIMKIIYMYRLVLIKCDTLDLCKNCLEPEYLNHYHSEERQNVRSILKHINNVSAYKFTNRNLYSELTIEAIGKGDCTYLNILTKYGLSCFPENEINRTGVELGHLYDMYYDYLRDIRQTDLEINRYDFIKSSLRLLFQDVENQNFRRVILIIRTVEICLSKPMEFRYYPDCVKCMKSYVLTLTEPVISVEDMKNFLNLIFRNDRTFINEICTIFNEAFSGSPTFPSPRSLKDLCSCTVRDCIRKIPSLPAVLSSIPIPREVKNYLLYLSE